MAEETEAVVTDPTPAVRLTPMRTTLILAADRDTFTPPRCSQRMFEQIPTAEIQWFEHTGHTLPIEEPEAILAHVEEWYQRRVVHR